MGDARAEVLDREQCLRLLAQVPVGRVAVVDDGGPVVLPVNHRLVRTVGPEAREAVWVLMRTAVGSTLDRQGLTPAAFQADGIDEYHRRGWSVLARGVLHHLDTPSAAWLAEHCRPEPWLVGPLERWIGLEVTAISGRRLVDAEQTWVFHVRGYL
jgi:nitroimidazol reductase NimA-like FMN-containing flavoprotein (pyridoxamine 5'-phosphate oxidase superfamily)